MHSVVTHSAAETEALGVRLAQFLSPGDFIALHGELGAGKTCFVRGVAAGLGVDPATYITSPTYTLMNVYQGRHYLFHFDLYRIDFNDVAALGFDDYFYGNGVSLVEWSERLDEDLPAERLEISFFHVDDTSRRLELVPFGASWDRTLRLL